MKLKRLVGTTRLVSFPRTLRPRRRHTPLPPARALARRRSLPRGDAVPAAIAAACADVLAGLDEDTLAYVSEGVADSLDDRDELVDFVSGMCGELCDGDDEAARAKADALWERLHASSSTASPAPAPLARPPISLGASHSALEAATLAEAESLRAEFASVEIKFDHVVGAAGSAAAAKARRGSRRGGRSSRRRRDAPPRSSRRTSSDVASRRTRRASRAPPRAPGSRPSSSARSRSPTRAAARICSRTRR